MKTAAIGIVGAGPAGLTCAEELRKRGFRDITVFGDFSAAQVRTENIDGVTADLAACYLHAGYWNTVVPLVREHGLRLRYLPPAQLVQGGLEPFRPTRTERLRTAVQTARFLLSSVRYLATCRGEGSRRYGVSLEAFLAERGLGALAHSFILGPGGVAQGYGYLDRVAAHGALRWFRPSLFATALTQRFGRGTAIIVEGYGTLFRRILEKHRHENRRVARVAAGDGAARPRLGFEDGAEREFDQVIVACPLTAVESPVSAAVRGGVESTRLFSVLWRSAQAPRFADRVYCMDHLRAKAGDRLLTFRCYGRSRRGDWIYWGVGYAEAEPFGGALAQIRGDFGFADAEVIEQRAFDYNLRFTAEAIARGAHREVERRQGEGGVWYSGGLLSHWDIDAIAEHNRRLVRRLAHRLSPPRGWARVHAGLEGLRLAVEDL